MIDRGAIIMTKNDKVQMSEQELNAVAGGGFLDWLKRIFEPSIMNPNDLIHNEPIIAKR